MHSHSFGPLLLAVLFTSCISTAYSQNYTSAANGSWTTGSNWVGGSSPSLTSQSWGTINVNHNLVITGNYNLPGGSINIAAGKSLDIIGSLTTGLGGGGNTINVSGTLNISGNVNLHATLNILPGGKVVVDGSVKVVSSTYLNVGTNASPPPYADLVIKQNLNSETSGDVLVEKNGRVAIYGNLINSGSTGGTLFTVQNGGQVYIHGNINLTGNGGDQIVNNNSSSPYGLYVNGTITNSGGGSTTTANKGNQSTMQSTNPDFFNWVASQSGSPLPVELLFFVANSISGSVELEWATSSELNFDYFSIQRSTNGKDFEEIGQAHGHGTTEERHDYSFVDESVLVQKLYYRLKTVDFDGYTEYSNIAIIDFSGAKTAVVYPNPVEDGRLFAKFNFDLTDKTYVEITDMVGSTKLSLVLPNSGTDLLIPISIEPGTYILLLKTGDFKSIQRIVVK
ncbi:MAG: T9SS type A sorting domain-containing protein [Cyclobacteriaceae bacterium]|nr:T9SS type A sorting domain-containing protein [Cyclobacteriaceae bacterium]